MAAHSVRILLLPGSLRGQSSNGAVLRTAAAVAPRGVETVTYDDAAGLPHFNPDDDLDGGPVHPAVETLRSTIRSTDAILICTPEYAGALPGSFKNVLEWTVGDASTYQKPVAWINASSRAAPTGGADAHDSLRKVLAYVGADIVEAAVLRLPVERSDVGGDGFLADPDMRARVASTLTALATHVRSRPPGGEPA
jgi:NAD(P)H-dependent FMN reductase